MFLSIRCSKVTVDSWCSEVNLALSPNSRLSRNTSPGAPCHRISPKWAGQSNSLVIAHSAESMDWELGVEGKGGFTDAERQVCLVQRSSGAFHVYR